MTKHPIREVAKREIDFSKIVIMISCFGNSRVTEMYATAISLILTLHKARIVILFNDTYENLEPKSAERFEVMSRLAVHQNVDLQIYYHAPEMSLANMYWNALHTSAVISGRDYWMSVDDDVLVPKTTLEFIEQVVKQEFSLLLYGFYELVNRRGYKDWQDKKVEWNAETCESLTKDFGEKTLIHQCWKVPKNYVLNVLKVGQHAGSFIARIDELRENKKLMNALQDWPKGLRGVDVAICKSFAENPILIVGANAYHTDCTGSTLDGKLWKEDVPSGLKS